jgi:hypothetical protein
VRPIREELRYPGLPAVVFDLVFKASFQLELMAYLGGQQPEVVEETTREDGGLKLVTRQRASVEMPAFVKKVIPADTTVTQTYDWGPASKDGARKGTWSAEIRGAPIRLGGPTELLPDGGATVHIYLGEARASVPIVGGRLEAFAVENLRRDLAQASKFIADRLTSETS